MTVRAKHYKAQLKDTDLKVILTDFLLKLGSLPVEVAITLQGQLNEHVDIKGTFVPEHTGIVYFLDVHLEIPTPHFVSIICKH